MKKKNKQKYGQINAFRNMKIRTLNLASLMRKNMNNIRNGRKWDTLVGVKRDKESE